MPSPPRSSGRKRLSAPARRAQIIESAREVFLEEGFVGARTRLIAERAAINEAILYKHFASKDELFHEAVLVPLDDELRQMADRLVALFDGGGDASRDSIALAVERELLHSMEQIFPLLGVALFAGSQVGRDFYRDRLYGQLGSALTTMTKRAGIPARATGQGRVVSLILGVAIGHALDAYFRDVRLGYTRIAKQLTPMLVHGIGGAPPAS